MSGAAYEAPRFCREKARSLVHTYAAGGCAWAVLPIPIATSTGLCALETHMIYWIGRVYAELASVGLKTVALNAANFLPVIGWAIKGAIAATTIEGLGEVIIRHFETRHPGKVYAG